MAFSTGSTIELISLTPPKEVYGLDNPPPTITEAIRCALQDVWNLQLLDDVFFNSYSYHTIKDDDPDLRIYEVCAGGAVMARLRGMNFEEPFHPVEFPNGWDDVLFSISDIVLSRYDTARMTWPAGFAGIDDDVFDNLGLVSLYEFDRVGFYRTMGRLGDVLEV